MSASPSRRGAWIALGAIFIVGGLVAAVLLWNGASQRRTSAVENFARAPVGCDTTLDFIEPGEYLLFVETAGNLDEVRGDCNVEGAFESSDDDIDVEITIVDPDNDEVDVDRSSGDVEYDVAGFAGVARFTIDIDETDDHVLRAESDAGEVFVVAVGRDPNAGVAPLRIGAIAAGTVGLLAGLAFVLLGVRRSSATVPAAPWNPGAPQPPGVFVPGAAPPQGPPVYGQQGGPPQHDPSGGPQYAAPQYGQQPPAQPAQPGQFGQPPPPTYGQQPPPPQASPQYGQAPMPQSPPPQPAAPQYPQPPFAQPNIPGQPSFPQAPADPAGSAQPIDWAPSVPPPPASAPVPSTDPNPSETAPPDAEFLAQLREERSTQERQPPAPPE